MDFFLNDSISRIDDKDSKDLTALDYACAAVASNSEVKSRAFECAKLLLSRGCNFEGLRFMSLDMVASDGRTLIHWAAKIGQFKLLTHLLETYPEFIKRKDQRGWTPLMCSALCTTSAVNDTMNFLLKKVISSSSPDIKITLTRVEAIADVFAALSIGMETWNQRAVNIILSFLGKMCEMDRNEVCRMFSAHVATTITIAAMVSTIAAVVATKAASDAGLAFERVKRKRVRKIQRLTRNVKKEGKMSRSIMMFARLHTRRHHDNWLHWMRRVSRDMDEHYYAATHANEVYWPEMELFDFVCASNGEEDKKRSVKFYSHRASIETIPNIVEEEEKQEEDSDDALSSTSRIGISHGGDTLQVTLTILGLEDKEMRIRQKVGSDLSFLHWSVSDMQRGESIDKTNRKYNNLRAILSEDEIVALRKGLRITQDLRTHTSLELGTNSSSSSSQASMKYSLLHESISILKQNTMETNQNRLPTWWDPFVSTLKGINETLGIIGTSQGLFLTKNVGTVGSANKNCESVLLYEEPNLHAKKIGRVRVKSHVMIQSRSNGFCQVVEMDTQKQGWILNTNTNPYIFTAKVTDKVLERVDEKDKKILTKSEVSMLIDSLLEIMTVIQDLRYEIYCQELEENILALDHPYFPSQGIAMKKTSLRPMLLNGMESYSWSIKGDNQDLALRLQEDRKDVVVKRMTKTKRYHRLDVRGREREIYQAEGGSILFFLSFSLSPISFTFFFHSQFLISLSA